MSMPWPIVLTALLIIVLSVPLIYRRIPKNSFYGLRTPKTMAGSEAEWLAANQIAGRALCAAGITTIFGCVCLSALPLDSKTIALTSTGLLVAAVMGAVIYSIVRS